MSQTHSVNTSIESYSVREPSEVRIHSNVSQMLHTQKQKSNYKYKNEVVNVSSARLLTKSLSNKISYFDLIRRVYGSIR